MAHIFTQHVLNFCFKFIKHIKRNKRLYSSGKTTAVNSVRAFVAKYFIACGIDPNRLITVGNGNTKMVADPGSADAYLNRRTDVFFKIIEE